jgi:hypothetical protein
MSIAWAKGVVGGLLAGAGKQAGGSGGGPLCPRLFLDVRTEATPATAPSLSTVLLVIPFERILDFFFGRVERSLLAIRRSPFREKGAVLNTIHFRAGERENA